MAPGLPAVVVESAGVDDILYTHGLDLIASTEPGGAREYYHYDGLGSARQLTDELGQVVVGYGYKPFGGLREVSGSSGNTFKFTGEQSDDELGLVYLRARYYDPEIGRFPSKDPFPGVETVPQSLNRYVYVLNNPVNDADPEGDLPHIVATTIIGAVAGAVIGGVAYAAECKLTGREFDTAELGGRVAGGLSVAP